MPTSLVRDKEMGSGCLAMLLAALLCSAPHAAQGQGLRLADAVRLALSQNPDILVQRTQIEAAAGQQQQAAGRFDSTVSSRLHFDREISPLTDGVRTASADPATTQASVVSTGYQLAIGKQLRNGLVVGASVDAAGTDGQAIPLQRQQNLSRLSLTLRAPLLQGRGSSVTAAEDAAGLVAQARGYELLDRAARTLYQTIVAYWNYRAQVDLERIAANSEERSRKLLESIQKLVAASEKPAADLVLANADLADKVVAREAAVLARNEARQALGRLLGMDAPAIAAMPEPADQLPGRVATPEGASLDPGQLRREALARRPDLRALALQKEAAQRDLDGVRDLLKPRMDLDLGVAYSKASEGGTRYGMLAMPGRLQSTPSLSVRLSYEFPVAGNRAKGAVRERSALLTQIQVQQRDLATGVETEVDSAMQSLRSSTAQLQVGRTGLALYERAVNQETTKQRNGISTLIDVINTESRYVNARVNFLQSQFAHATALAKLRLATGTLVPAPDAAGELTLDLTRLQAPDAGP
jgi:outer membrane protein TolC